MGTVIDDVISERISFLQEQIKPAINDTFQLQINILLSADLEKLDRSIVYKPAQCKDGG